jgi:hypothetical protein
MSADTIPRVYVSKLTNGFYELWCPFGCGQFHRHGGLGKRLSHCLPPFKKAEYELVERATPARKA